MPVCRAYADVSDGDGVRAEHPVDPDVPDGRVGLVSWVVGLDVISGVRRMMTNRAWCPMIWVCPAYGDVVGPVLLDGDVAFRVRAVCLVYLITNGKEGHN